MAGSPCFLLRFWRLHLGRNPLARPSDRAERVLVILAVLLALTGMPVAATVGSETVARGVERAQQEMNTRYPSIAVTLAEAPAPIASVGRGPAQLTSVDVSATWVTPDGTQGVGSVAVKRGTPLGTEQPIWLDETGNQTSAPFRQADAISAGLENGVLTWLAVLAPQTGSYWLAHLMLNRFRYAQWTREWERFGRDATHS